MEAKHTLLLIAQREIAGKASPAETSRFMDTELPLLRRKLVEDYSDEEYVTYLLDTIKTQKEESGVSASRLALSASAVLTSAIQLQEFAKQSFEGKLIPGYRFLFDVYIGMRHTLNALLLADSESRAETQIIDVVSSASDVLSTTIPEQADAYLFVKERVKQDAALLIEDPSGSSLLDSHLRQLESGEFLRESQSKDYVLAGATLAAELYRSVYEISAKLA